MLHCNVMSNCIKTGGDKVQQVHTRFVSDDALAATAGICTGKPLFAPLVEGPLLLHHHHHEEYSQCHVVPRPTLRHNVI